MDKVVVAVWAFFSPRNATNASSGTQTQSKRTRVVVTPLRSTQPNRSSGTVMKSANPIGSAFVGVREK